MIALAFDKCVIIKHKCRCSYESLGGSHDRCGERVVKWPADSNIMEDAWSQGFSGVVDKHRVVRVCIDGVSETVLIDGVVIDSVLDSRSTELLI